MAHPGSLLDAAFEGQGGGVVLTADGRRHQFGKTDRAVSVASVSKALFAYSVMIAVEEGSLELSCPYGPFGSTVRHLLAHASGVGFTDEEPICAPGTRRIYSNYGFDLLGEVLERETQMTAADYLSAAVFEPLGMKATSLQGSPAKDVVSTADDLTRFLAELLNPTLIDTSTHLNFTSAQFADLAGTVPGIGLFRPNPWGLGVEIRGAKHPHWTAHNNSIDTYGHFGGLGSFIWVDPVAAVAMVATNDRRFGPWALRSWPALGDAALARFGVTLPPADPVRAGA